MPSTQDIKRRIRSVKNTKKITKAMELVAASKMKRAVSATLQSRVYAEYSWEILTSIAENVEDNKDSQPHPFFEEREEGKTLIVLITSNRGLCGAYNAQVIKKTILKLKELTGGEVDVVAVGKKGNVAMERVGANVISSFNELPDAMSLLDTRILSKHVIEEYQSGKYNKIYVAYTDFISALSQKANLKQLLPINRSELKELIEGLDPHPTSPLVRGRNKEGVKYIFEGNKEQIISSLAEKLVRMQIYQMLLESSASEQSSRMVAMKNANEASGEMIDDLTLVFNKARQSNITREISEISAGMASVS